MGHYFTAAVVGLGRIGSSYPSTKIPRSHTAAYLENDRIKIIAAVDPNPLARLNFRKKWGNDIKVFSSVNKMITSEQHPDIVSLCITPDAIEKTIKDFESFQPKLYFLEKPAVTNQNQCRKLLSAVNATPVAVNYHRCWDPKIGAFIEKIKTKKIFTIRVLYSKGIFNYASHIIALLIQNFGEATSAVQIPTQEKSSVSNDQSYSFCLNFEQKIVAFFQGADGLDYDLLEVDFITDEGIYSLKSGGCRQRIEVPVKDLFYENYSSLSDAKIDNGDGQNEGLPQAVDNIINFLDKKINRLNCDLKTAISVFELINQVTKKDSKI